MSLEGSCVVDIRLIRKQLQIEYANLNAADFDSASLAASDFYDFIQETGEIRKILNALPDNSVDLDDWMANFYNQQEMDIPRKKQERISFFLAFLEKNKGDLLSIAHYFRGGSSKYIDHIRKYIDTMVKPIYQYIDNELHIIELESSPLSPTSITANHSIIINGNNYGSISQTNIEAVELLGQLSENLQKSNSLSAEQKLEAANNIDTIKSQVISPKPNAQIIKLAWQTVSAAANIAGAADLASKIAQLISVLSA